MPIRPGAKPRFASPRLEQEWNDPKVTFCLRATILIADMIFAELGGRRVKITRLLDEKPPYCYGTAAELSVLELPGVRVAQKGIVYKTPAWICERLNLLMPYGDGSIVTALYDGEKIALRVPSNGGFRPDACALGEWFLFGATGDRVLNPRKVKV